MRTISTPAAAIACALALSPVGANAAPLTGPADASPVSWLEFRAAFAAEDLWPVAVDAQPGSVKHKVKTAEALDAGNHFARIKTKVSGASQSLALAAPQLLQPGKGRQTVATVN